jgi:hypothetical protein
VWVSIANDNWLSTWRRKPTSRSHWSSCCTTAPTRRANVLRCAGSTGAIWAMSTRCFELALNPRSLLSPPPGLRSPSTSGTSQCQQGRGEQFYRSIITNLSSLALPPLSVPSSLPELTSSSSLPFPLSGSATSILLATSCEVREKIAYPMPLPLA